MCKITLKWLQYYYFFYIDIHGSTFFYSYSLKRKKREGVNMGEEMLALLKEELTF